MTFVRSLLFNAFFFASTFVLAVAGIGYRIAAADRTIELVEFWARLQIAAARIICGIRFEVSGLEHIPPGAALIASQHQSTFDTLVWFKLLPRCSYVAKQELTKIPLFGALIRPAGLIVVDRAGGAAALRGLVRDARRAVTEGRQIVIFPEGTRGEPGRALPIQPGIVALATATRLPVIPVTTDSGLRWGRRAFRKLAGTIHIVIRPPLPPTLTREELTEELRNLFGSERIAVDKTVGGASEQLRQNCSQDREGIEL